ncbi:hypothetical protein HYH03_006651 [Edaphochlamys debaryana]|uniref:DUF1499 domain-containing protein n=1 Tax=Edaphochlamys debaryana TaxID=47281 RepID=A0A835Y624_9CHLO|nr:hypothetical protein HYH03_006651 [Edaphochlamys debaryana]|eukprot:KAG2495383.1 hypothetical protein HYH03_006651 [Edaphochlamys debaryana]
MWWRAPVLNDVSTDLDDPPQFLVAPQRELPEAWRRKIRAAYPDVQPLRVRVPPGAAAGAAAATGASEGGAVEPEVAAVLDAATAAARGMPRWEVVAVRGGALEAVSTTRLWRFKDDVVVRLRAEAGGEWQGAEGRAGAVVRVDVRSRSRVGKGDLGANGERIRQYLGRLGVELKARGLALA